MNHKLLMNTIQIILVYILFNVYRVLGAYFNPAQYYHPLPMMNPFYPAGIVPQVPMGFPPYFPQFQPSNIPGNQSPLVIPPSMGPGSSSLAAALNLPSPAGSDENIAGQIGHLVQFPEVPKSSSIPLSLLSSNVPMPKSPQVSAAHLKPDLPNNTEKTAPLPVLY